MEHIAFINRFPFYSRSCTLAGNRTGQCVLDFGNRKNCSYAKSIKTKNDCKYYQKTKIMYSSEEIFEWLKTKGVFDEKANSK